MAEWISIIDAYLKDLQSQTTTALEKLNEELLKSGLHFDTKIKEYFMNSTKRR